LALRVVAPVLLLEKAVVNATEPPLEAAPETTLNALLSCVVDFVQPVGAEVWTKSMTVPDAKASTPAKVSTLCNSSIVVPLRTNG
jgi:hypothetical protein